MKKWEAKFGNVTEVEVERETAACAWIEGRRRKKDEGWRPLFDSAADAWAHIREEAEGEVAERRKNLEYAEAQLRTVLMRTPLEFLPKSVAPK